MSERDKQRRRSRREKLAYHVYRALLYGLLYVAMTPLAQRALLANWPSWLKREIGPVDLSLVYATVIVTVLVSFVAWMLSRRKKAQHLALWCLSALLLALTLLGVILA